MRQINKTSTSKIFFFLKNPFGEASQKDQITKKEEQIRLASDISAQPSTPRGDGAMPTDYSRKERMSHDFVSSELSFRFESCRQKVLNIYDCIALLGLP